MARKQDLETWVAEALRSAGGSARLIEIARRIWEARETELRRSGDLFYTWQYDMRWAANQLRRKGIMKSTNASPIGVWEIADKS
jgi:hypothetical protein